MSLKGRALALEQSAAENTGLMASASAGGIGVVRAAGGAGGAAVELTLAPQVGRHVRTVVSDQVNRQLTLLKKQVQHFVSINDLALMVASQPVRARNELKSACAQAFSLKDWAGVSEAEKLALIGRLLDEVFGFGPLEPLLNDETVTEVMVNGPSKVFFERQGVISQSDVTFANAAQLRALIDRVLGPLGRRVDEASPMVSARLPEGHRVNVVMPPLALEGPYVTIRKFTSRVLRLSDLQESGSFDAQVAQFFKWAVLARKSIAVSGGTGSGKTTLLNALSCELPKSERIVTIEDSAELRFFEHPHVVRLEARQASAEGTGEVTIRDLVINALRMRPDRIVVGECRGEEAIDMLQAMTTGHDGSLTTLHANSSKDAIARLTTMVRYGLDLPVDVIEANIASAFDVVVQTARSLDGKRYVSELAEFAFDVGARRCVVRQLYVRNTPESAGKWVAVPAWLEAANWLGATHEEVNLWKQQLCMGA